MADQDDFEPGGRAWRKLDRMYLDEECSADQIVGQLQSRIALMLRVCAGITVLPELMLALTNYRQDVIARSLWRWQSSETAETAFDASLAKLAREHAPQRLNMVAIRSARAIAISIASNHFRLMQPVEAAEQIVVDLARHKFLDRARALAVGKRFSSGEESHAFYGEVLRQFRPHARRIGASLLHDPTAATVRRDRKALHSTTRALMFESDVSV